MTLCYYRFWTAQVVMGAQLVIIYNSGFYYLQTFFCHNDSEVSAVHPFNMVTKLPLSYMSNGQCHHPVPLARPQCVDVLTNPGIKNGTEKVLAT